MSATVCGLCGHAMTFDRCGLAGAWDGDEMTPLCHADDHDCYVRWLEIHDPDPPDADAARFYLNPEQR